MKFPGWRRRRHEDLDQEIRDHLRMAVRDRIDGGASPEEAGYAARREFGNVGLVKEITREMWGGGAAERVLSDARIGIRMFLRNPAFTLVTLLTLTLGIGATTAIFSVVNAVVVRPLPYHEPGRLVMLWTDNPRQGLHEIGTSYLTFEEWRGRARIFEDLAICSRANPVDLDTADQPERLEGALVSANLFPLLGVAPALGRTWSADEDAHASPLVVLSHGLWMRRFGGAADVLEKTLIIGGRPSRVIGVMPPGFEFPSRETAVWEPATRLSNWNNVKTNRYSHMWRVIGRLEAGVTPVRAQSEMSAIGAVLERTSPPADPAQGSSLSYGVNVVPLNTHVVGRDVRLAVWALFAAVVFVLLIAATNVANLLLVRGMARERELGIRLAMGAGRGRLIAQMLTESTVLALVAGGAGTLFAAAGVRVLAAFGPPNIPRLDQVRIDPIVLLFGLGVSLLSGVLFGLLPALKLSRRGLNDTLKEGGRSVSAGLDHRRTRNLLVIAELALAVALLSGAGLLIRSFIRIQEVNPGFRPERVLAMRVDVPRARTDAETIAFYHDATGRVAGLPGVVAVGLINEFFIEKNPDDLITVEGHPALGSAGAVEQLWDDAVSPGYFQAMGVPLLGGRFFSDADGRESRRVAIVNHSMARRFWPGEDPLGRRFKFGAAQSTEPWLTVVGIVADMHRQGLERAVISQFFVPHTQSPGPGMLRGMNLMVRTLSDPLSVAPAVRAQLASLDKTVPVHGLTTVERQLQDLLAQRRFQTSLMGAFSAVALFLAGVGIYGVMHYSVARRTHELGVRMALGARRRDVLTLVIVEGMTVAAAGIGIGLAGALWLTQAISNLLFDVSPTDPATFGAVSLLLTAVALLACYVPARRASHVDPIVALRCE